MLSVCVALINIDVVNYLQYVNRHLDNYVWVFTFDSSTLANFLRFSKFLIIFDGVANNTKLHLKRSKRKLLFMNQITVLNTKISGTIKAAYVKTLPIDI